MLDVLLKSTILNGLVRVANNYPTPSYILLGQQLDLPIALFQVQSSISEQDFKPRGEDRQDCTLDHRTVSDRSYKNQGTPVYTKGN